MKVTITIEDFANEQGETDNVILNMKFEKNGVNDELEDSQAAIAAIYLRSSMVECSGETVPIPKELH